MTFEAERIAIESRWSSNWGTLTPTSFDNIPYEPTPGEPYVELHIFTGDSFVASLGRSPLYRTSGVISMDIFTPVDQGTKAGRVLADTASAIFRGVKFSGILCRAPSLTRLGKDAGWYRYNVSVNFQRDETF